MNWKKETADKLREYEAKRSALVCIPMELRELEMAAVSIRSSTGASSPVRGGGSAYEDRLINNISRRQELERNLEAVKAWVARMDKALAVLTKEERLVLDRFYIHPARGNVDKLCGELACEQATVYRRRDAALRKITVAMYGITES